MREPRQSPVPAQRGIPQGLRNPHPRDSCPPSDPLPGSSILADQPIDRQEIRHYLLAQQSTWKALSLPSVRTAQTISDYETERMFEESGDKAGDKRPDVVWRPATGKEVGVEIELSAKWDRRLNEFVLGICRALQARGIDSPARYQRFVIVTDSPAIARRYETAMQPGADLPIWKKKNRAHWEIEKVVQVPSWLIEHVDFNLLER